jgi:hypothetical protein
MMINFVSSHPAHPECELARLGQITTKESVPRSKTWILSIKVQTCLSFLAVSYAENHRIASGTSRRYFDQRGFSRNLVHW